MKPLIVFIAVLAVILTNVLTISIYTSLAEEIKVSRERENLLLKEVKLLDYQISVLSESFMGEK